MRHLVFLMDTKYSLTEAGLQFDVGVTKLGHRHRILASLQGETAKDREIAIEKEHKFTVCEMCFII